MSHRYGFDAFVAVGKETTWGTSVGRTKFMEFNGESGGFAPGRQELPTWRARIVPSYYDIGNKALKSISMPLYYESVWMFLRNALTNYTSSGATTTGVTHIFKVGTTQSRPSLSVEVANTEYCHIYAGSHVRKLGMEFNASESAKWSIDFIAKTESTMAKTALGTVPLPSLLIRPTQASLLINSTSTGTTELDSFSINIETGLDDGRVKVGSANIVEPDFADRFKISGTINRDWSDPALYAALLANTTFALNVTFTSAATISGSTYWTLNLLIPNAYIMGDPPVHTGPGLVPEVINWNAADAGTTTGIQITVVNTEAAY